MIILSKESTGAVLMHQAELLDRGSDSGEGVMMAEREQRMRGGRGGGGRNACGFHRYLPDCLVTVSQL